MLSVFMIHSNKRIFNYYIPVPQVDFTSFLCCACNAGQQLHPDQIFLPKNDFDNIKLSQMAPESKDFTNSTWSINPPLMLNTAKAVEQPFHPFFPMVL